MNHKSRIVWGRILPNILAGTIAGMLGTTVFHVGFFDWQYWILLVPILVYRLGGDVGNWLDKQ